MKEFIIFILLLISASNGQAQAPKQSDDWYNLVKVDNITLTSDYNKRTYKIHISTSFDSAVPGKKYPVLYYTDAWECTPMMTLFAKALEGYGETNPFILVGISFDADPDSFLELRKQDFKPDLKTGSSSLSFSSPSADSCD